MTVIFRGKSIRRCGKFKIYPSGDVYEYTDRGLLWRMRLTETQYEYICTLNKNRYKLKKILELGPEAIEHALSKALAKQITPNEYGTGE